MCSFTIVSWMTVSVNRVFPLLFFIQNHVNKLRKFFLMEFCCFLWWEKYLRNLFSPERRISLTCTQFIIFPFKKKGLRQYRLKLEDDFLWVSIPDNENANVNCHISRYACNLSILSQTEMLVKREGEGFEYLCDIFVILDLFFFSSDS